MSQMSFVTVSYGEWVNYVSLALGLVILLLVLWETWRREGK